MMHTNLSEMMKILTTEESNHESFKVDMDICEKEALYYCVQYSKRKKSIAFQLLIVSRRSQVC
jgi:hypothetical protein